MTSTSGTYNPTSSGDQWQGTKYEFLSFEAKVKNDCQALGIFDMIFTNPPENGTLAAPRQDFPLFVQEQAIPANAIPALRAARAKNTLCPLVCRSSLVASMICR